MPRSTLLGKREGSLSLTYIQRICLANLTRLGVCLIKLDITDVMVITKMTRKMFLICYMNKSKSQYGVLIIIGVDIPLAIERLGIVFFATIMNSEYSQRFG